MSIKTRRATTSGKSDDGDGVAVQPHVQVKGDVCLSSKHDGLPQDPDGKKGFVEDCRVVFCGSEEEFKTNTCATLADMQRKCVESLQTSFESGPPEWIKIPSHKNKPWLEPVFRVLPVMIDNIQSFDKSKNDEECRKVALEARKDDKEINVYKALDTLYENGISNSIGVSLVDVRAGFCRRLYAREVKQTECFKGDLHFRDF